MGAHTIGQSPQELPQELPQDIHVPQQVSASIQHPVPPVYQTGFSSSPFTTTDLSGLPPHLPSGSIPSTASGPLIRQSSLNPSLAGPPTLPSQGVLEKALHFLIIPPLSLNVYKNSACMYAAVKPLS